MLAADAGWLVIHSDNNGAPGPVVGHVAVPQGLSTDLTVDGLDPTKLTPVLWLMLHVDDHAIGVYEFGTVQGADAPVMVDGKVVVAPLRLTTAASATETPVAGAATCTVISTGTVNRRSGAGTNFRSTGSLRYGQTAAVTGQTQGADGFIWYQTDDGSFVRSDVVNTAGDCTSVPTVNP